MASRFLFRRRISLFYTALLVLTVVVSHVFLFFAIDSRELAVKEEALSGQVRQLRMSVDSLFGRVRSDLAFLADRVEFQDLKTWYQTTDYRQKKVFLTAIAPLTVLLDHYDEVVIFSPQDQVFLDMKNKLVAPVSGSRLATKLKVLTTSLASHPDQSQVLTSLVIDGEPATYFLRIIGSPENPVLLIVQLNASFFGTILNGLLLAEDTWVTILNQEGDLIQSRYKGEVSVSEDDREQVPGKYLVGTDTSPDSGWTFRFGIDVRTIQARVLGVLMGYSLLPLGVLIVALVVLSRLSRRLYQPVTELFEALKPYGGAEMTDEFAQIQRNLEGLLTQNTELKETVRITRHQGGQETLRALVTRRGVTGEEVLATLGTLGWEFPTGEDAGYQIHLYLYREVAVVPDPEVANDPEFRAYFRVDERVIGCLAGFPSRDHTLASEVGLDPRVQAQGISDIHRRWDDLPEAFREARTALEYRTLSPENPRILYSEVKRTRKVLYFYPIDAEHRLVNGLKQLDVTQVAEGLAQFEEAVREAGVAFGNQKHLYFHLLDTMMSLLRDFDVGLGTADQCTLEGLWEHMAEADKSEGLAAVARGVATQVLASLGQNKESTSAAVIANEARALIESRYTDRNLSLDLIATSLGYSVSHVSSIFRMFFGETIKNTITGLRLSKAKELLADTDEKVLRIGELVGYDNVGSFEKIFKAYIGESPKEYRLRIRRK